MKEINMDQEIEIAIGIISATIDAGESDYVDINMDWPGNTTLRDIIDFNDALRGEGYETKFEIYGDDGRDPHVIASIRKMEE